MREVGTLAIWGTDSPELLDYLLGAAEVTHRADMDDDRGPASPRARASPKRTAMPKQWNKPAVLLSSSS